MEITEVQLSTVLQEALTCFLAFLSHTQKLREAGLPRQGKGVETTADVSTYDIYKSKVAGTETCLQYSGKIARNVRRWSSRPPRGSEDEEAGQTEVVSFNAALSEEIETSFMDVFSGNWVSPVASFSAGPSGSGIEDPLRRSNDQRNPETSYRRRRRRRETIETDEKSDSPIIRYKSQTYPSRASIGMHPNIPISRLDTLAEHNFSVPSTISNSTSHNVLTPSTSICSNRDIAGTETKSVSFRRRSSGRDDGTCAKEARIQEQEKRQQREELLMASTRQLAEQQAEEETSRLRAQEKYARNFERAERDRVGIIEKDREVARKAQEQWELAAIAAETAAMRREERMRREEAEAKHAAHEERKKIRREKAWAAEVQERDRLFMEEKRRKAADDIARLRRKHEKAERARKADRVDCVSCMETGEKKDMVILACNHPYCGGCIKGAFKSAYKSRTPFTCCSKAIPLSPTITPHISSSFTRKYTLLLLELSTRKPKYCSSPSCSKFIPPSHIHGPIATCPSCKTATCIACGRQEHKGVCKEDKEGKAVEALAKKKGWKQCPKCGQILERTEGCLHMTCRCRAEWCYSCLRDWAVCRSSCGRNEFATEMRGAGLGMMEANVGMNGFIGDGAGDMRGRRIGFVPVVAAAMLFSLFNDD